MKKAATAARRAARLYPATRPASLDGTTDGTGVALGTVLFVLFDAAITKLAQVMRVVLLVWINRLARDRRQISNNCRKVWVAQPSDERTRGNSPVLSSQIADLTVLGRAHNTRIILACVLRIQMAEGRGAVSAGRDWQVMDMVHEWAVQYCVRETFEVHAYGDTGAGCA